MSGDASRPTRRGLFRGAAALAAAGSSPGTTEAAGAESNDRNIEPFWGLHQGGIATPPQRYVCAAALDLVADDAGAVGALLQSWTDAAARMSQGRPSQALEQERAPPAPDSGETLGLPQARLTVTFGFGVGLFVKDGKDRYGLAAQRPPALVDLPAFSGDELIETRTGGDLSVQACADDPQVAFHAVRQLARLAYRTAELRWVQTGFTAAADPRQTPRNLMGFKDGTSNVSIRDPAAMEKFVWVGDEGPDWMRGGSYVVLRRIRIALAHWDRMPVGFQEQAIGRHKSSGAPLGRTGEFDPAALDAVGEDGDPVIPESAHVRLAAAASNDGAQILRRPYSYNDGLTFVRQRWEPWREETAYDAGLFFVCYQRDPRTGFIKIFDRLAQFDMLNQFVTHTGGGLFACPRGAAEGEFVGQGLFERPR